MGKTFLKRNPWIRYYRWIGVGTVVSLMLVWAIYGLFCWYTISHEKKQLRTMLEKEQQRLEQFFNERLQAVTQLATEQPIADFCAHPDDTSLTDALRTMLTTWQKNRPYSNIFVIDSQGMLIFSQQSREDTGKSVTQGIFGTTALSDVVKKVFQDHTGALSDISYYPGELRPTMFVAAPYMPDGKLRAVVVAQLTDKAIFEVSQSKLTSNVNAMLAKKTDDHALLVTPLPNDPAVGLLHAIALDDPRAYGFKQAFAGKEGAGVTRDYYNQKIIAAWGPAKLLDWGLLIAISEAVVFHPTDWLFNMLVTISITIMILFGILGLLLLIWWWLLTHETMLLFLQGRAGRSIIGILFVIATMGVLFFGNRYIHLLWWRSYVLQNEIKMKGQYAVQQITHHFFKIEDTANTICYNLSLIAPDAAHADDITKMIESSLNNNPAILGIYVAYNPQIMPNHALFAPYVVRKIDKVETGMIATTYDYTKPNGKDLPDTTWYHAPLDQHKQIWLDPFFDKLSNTLAIAISTPFYAQNDTQKTQPLGVVSILCGLHEIKDLILSLGISGAGYSLLISPNGSFIYHPKGALVLDRATIFDLAKDTKQPLLAMIGKEATAGKRGLMPLNYRWWGAKALYAYYQHIPLTQWSLIMVFIADESLRAVKEIHRVFMLLTICIVLSLAFLIIFVAFSFSLAMTKRRLIIILALYTITMLFGMLAILGESRQTLVTSFPGETIITDNISLRRFMDKVDETIVQRHESAPLEIKTGLLINLIDFTTFGSVKFSGYVWQDYPVDLYKKFELGVSFPQAQEIKKNNKTYEYQYGNTKIVGWEINGQLVQRQRYGRYPFDENRVEIIMEPADETRNILLVPDLQSYRLVNPSSKPAFNSEFLYSGFAIEKSFFSFRTYMPDTNLGMPNYLTATQRVHLVYNILSLRSWLHSFIVFFLPLTVIMFLLFALLFVLESSAEALHSPVKVITAAASLFFSTLVGHQLFRQQFQLSAVTYIEYFFFLSYVTIALLIVYTSLLIQKNIKKPRKLFSFWFWPLQGTAWFIITAIIFY